uniref:Uncharacterized protein n=1 Tax=Megaselia scalaris TaxID=36166 RepID=T1GVR1_MEGSC
MANQKSCASKELKEADLKDFSKQCEATPKGEEDYACYIQRLKNNVVVRDCISTAKALSLNINENACDASKVENTKCNFCKGKDCNKGEPRNSGTHLQVVAGLVAFAAIFVTKYL